MISLKNIKFWIFDLDNTLYSSTTNIFSKIDKKMCQFIIDELSVNETEALKIKNKYFHEHGTTLNGLMKKHNINAERFLEFVHDIDYSFLNKNEKLNYELKKLPGLKIIFTNGSKKHAETTILKLGIKDNFSGIFDIVDSDYIPKPDIAPYKKLIDKYRIDCSKSIFFEDIAKNLLPAHQLGIKTAWIENDDKYCKEGFDGNHVDFRVKNLTKFLEDINKKVA
tara:strand:- start:36 stop:704 length:669 start_codon:yes stop_codon:yes gene_type:complete